MKPRWYQTEAVEALYAAAEINGTMSMAPVHPVAAIPTGAGKTLIICMLIDKILSNHPFANILILSHVKEILEQNYNAILKYFNGIDIGLYSAGLQSKTVHKITVGGIQSLYNNPDLFEDVDIIIIDEAHLVSMNDEGMYRMFLSELECTYIGLTATPFRTSHGYIHEGKGALFNKLAYDLTSVNNFNRLIDDGYLTKLISKETDLRMPIDGINSVGGDYNQKQLGIRFDRDGITEAACLEIIKYGKNYKKWLIFAINIAHAEHIAKFLNENGIPTIGVHSQLMEDRSQLISDFKEGKYRAIVNVNILTTGFDVPSIDLIAMLRPTQSPIIHVQTAGRGLRIAPGKDHCLFLDFAGNRTRLGPINEVLVKTKYDKSGKGVAPSKVCPDCDVIHNISVKTCYVCDHQFEFEEKITPYASHKDIIKGDKDITWLDVTGVYYHVHKKRGKPPSLKVAYRCGLYITITGWVFYEYTGYAKRKADAWVKYRLPKGIEKPKTVAGLFAINHLLAKPKRIKADLSEKYPVVLESEF